MLRRICSDSLATYPESPRRSADKQPHLWRSVQYAFSHRLRDGKKHIFYVPLFTLAARKFGESRYHDVLDLLPQDAVASHRIKIGRAHV